MTDHAIITNDELADSLRQILADCAPSEWSAYECGSMQEQEACTVGHFGDWVIGSATPGVKGGNYRDSDTGDDEAHACFMALVKNHAPQIIAALRGISDEQRAHQQWVRDHQSQTDHDQRRILALERDREMLNKEALRLDAEIARLTKERDEAIAERNKWMMQDAATSAELDATQQRASRLEGALLGMRSELLGRVGSQHYIAQIDAALSQDQRGAVPGCYPDNAADSISHPSNGYTGSEGGRQGIAPTIPEGWKLVPPKVTLDINNAICRVMGWPLGADDQDVHDLYNAMLAAAPSQPSPSQDRSEVKP